MEKRIPRILLVDSESQWSQTAESNLEKHGKYDVEIVVNIDEALKSFHADGFDFILINAALAFGDDISKFKEIVRIYRDKVLVISDVRSIATATRVFKIGADYAEKPFEAERLIELVASRLQVYRATS